MLDEGNVMIFVVPVFRSVPTSRRGIRLKADVASYSFNHHDHDRLTTTSDS